MNKPSLTIERLREVLIYDPETGFFKWVKPTHDKSSNCRFDGTPAGTNCRGRVQICIDQVIHRAHRLAWFYVYGEWPKQRIDHINGNPSDNRISNLRDVSNSVNLQNQRRAHKRNKSGFLGVGPFRNGFRARIDHKHLGVFPTPEIAHEVYLKAKREMHEGNTL